MLEVRWHEWESRGSGGGGYVPHAQRFATVDEAAEFIAELRDQGHRGKVRTERVEDDVEIVDGMALDKWSVVDEYDGSVLSH